MRLFVELNVPLRRMDFCLSRGVGAAFQRPLEPSSEPHSKQSDRPCRPPSALMILGALRPRRRDGLLGTGKIHLRSTAMYFVCHSVSVLGRYTVTFCFYLIEFDCDRGMNISLHHFTCSFRFISHRLKPFVLLFSVIGC